jgi:histone deacetylase complex regulatory component SIN3
MHIDTNSTAISALECAKKKIEKLTTEEAKKWMAEKENYWYLGCSFSVISRAIRTIYGFVKRILYSTITNQLI